MCLVCESAWKSDDDYSVPASGLCGVTFCESLYGEMHFNMIQLVLNSGRHYMTLHELANPCDRIPLGFSWRRVLFQPHNCETLPKAWGREDVVQAPEARTGAQLRERPKGRLG